MKLKRSLKDSTLNRFLARRLKNPMRNLYRLKLFIAPLIFLIISCSPTPTIKNLSEAHQEFLKLCQEEYKLNITLTPLENTLWIYLPITDGIIDIKATGYGIKTSDEGAPGFNLNYIDGEFKNEEFQITYDISDAMKYPKDLGYGTAYQEKFTLVYQSIFQAIQRTYLNIEKIPGEREFADQARNIKRERMLDGYIRRTKPPDFFVIVFADIKNGIEVKAIFNFEDYKKEMGQALAMDESPKRKINEVSGNKNMIGDEKGEYLEIREITWPEFLTKQIVHRINYAYGESNKKVAEQPEETILETIALVVKIYNFENYQSILLHNLRTEKNLSFNKTLIADYNIKDLNPKAKLHTLIFDDQGQISAETVRELE
ncbi:MAG: hypothetical protein KC733_10605 [Candidatus Omnitrophica bacterium]|nr:hypothetical protein [Candidatus Omnitrophota bacterium]